MSHTQVSAVQYFGRRDTWPENVIYVGMPGKPSRAFGIPDTEGEFGKPWECVNNPGKWGATNWQTAYMRYLVDRMEANPFFAMRVKALHGKTLLCWCAKKDADYCHAMILADFAELLHHA